MVCGLSVALIDGGLFREIFIEMINFPYSFIYFVFRLTEMIVRYKRDFVIQHSSIQLSGHLLESGDS